MAAELVNSATSDKLTEMDWMKNIEICELVAYDQGKSKDVIKAIKKRLGNKNPSIQLFSVLLLEMLMNNCGEHIHKQVISNGILPILVKIVKKKSGLPVREKIFLLLDAMQTSLGGASGKFPQYYAAYYDLVSAGVQFPQRPPAVASGNSVLKDTKRSLLGAGEKSVPPKSERDIQPENPQIVPESSIIQKAGVALEVLREVLDAIDMQHPEEAKDEFTLDLVEQCSFQKQRVMHLVMTSRDERVVSQAIELNEKLHKVLARHDVLLSVKATSTATHFDHEELEEEEAELLFRRIQKGKACAKAEDEVHLDLLGSIHAERLHRPLIRPLNLEPQVSNMSPPVVIPPPPARHVERERFFQDKRVDGSTLSGHMRGLSLHSRNPSSSNSGSIYSSD
ncbi:TOM1-like protein 5 [Macadamia integrifolia]|uniref:TOM1-like protein 5 n=1 Tax=Macadamia integrifolia TaxID=60698 RepID=UPI001C4F85BA|nr:TOM1-like protein 5 [Macadamia integrifolia]XP_042506168.1 TOM1-like protein 5 [Macadamia integrifolia]XP_042506174.1 TOM1-like protein 5 [Macadamia integrifolia]